MTKIAGSAKLTKIAHQILAPVATAYYRYVFSHVKVYLSKPPVIFGVFRVYNNPMLYFDITLLG